MVGLSIQSIGLVFQIVGRGISSRPAKKAWCGHSHRLLD